MSDRLYIVVPAYNEEDNIDNCIREWYKEIEKYGDADSRMVVVDDGSKDSTYSKLSQLKEEYPRLIPLSKPNGGHGSAVLYGYRYAIDNGAEWIFQTDSDGQTDPDEFSEFWEKRSEYDALIGVRRVRGDGKGRKFVENVVCLLLRVIFGVKVQDANAPYRLMKSELVRKYIDRLPADYNIPNIMLTTFFAYNKERLLFIPISFKPRQKGNTSIDPIKIIKIGWGAVGSFIGFKRQIDRF